MSRILYSVLAGLQAERLLWAYPRQQLRGICYHGVCADHLADEPWMPGYFVTESNFASQLRYLRASCHVLPLYEAVARLREGSLPSRAVSLTFDDGYANNLSLAYRLLKQYEMPAVVFLSSFYVESGQFYPFLKLRLISLYNERASAASAPEYKSRPLDEIDSYADQWWPEVRSRLTDEQLRTLRPLTVDEVRATDHDLIEFGAHTDRHCILSNESQARREQEIRDSVRKVEEWSGRPARLFSYPNGQPEDFGEQDKQTLRAAGVVAAVTGIAGSNDQETELLALRRYPVGLFHHNTAFRAEVAGLRSKVLAATRRSSS